MTDTDQPQAVATALAEIHERGEAVRQRELDTALGKLDDLDEEQRAVLADLSERLVASVLEAPSRSLVGASADGDTDAVRTALALFDADADSGRADEMSREQVTPEVARARD